MLDLFQILEDVCSQDLRTILSFIKSLLNLLCIAVPIMLIGFGSLDLGKAVMASDEKEIKGATSKLIKKAVAAVIVFFVPLIVSLIMGLVPKGTGNNPTDYKACWEKA